MKKGTLGFVEIFIASFLFGLIPLFVRLGENLGAYSLSFFRVFIGVVILWLFVKLTKKNLVPYKTEKKRLFIFGAVHGFIILSYFLAIIHLSIATAVLLLYSSSIWIILFSLLMLKELMRIKTMVALIVAFTGVLLLVGTENISLSTSPLGVIAGLIAGLGMGFVYTLSKTFKTYDKVSLTYWQNVIALPFMVPLLFVQPFSFEIVDIFIIIPLGALTVAGFVLLYKGFEKVEGQKGGVVILLDMVFPIMFGIFFLHEIPTLIEITGGLCIILGAVLATN